MRSKKLKRFLEMYYVFSICHSPVKFGTSMYSVKPIVPLLPVHVQCGLLTILLFVTVQNGLRSWLLVTFPK